MTAGYGVLKFRGDRMYAHRFSLEMHSGIDLDGLMVDHLCHQTDCVRPDHLRPANSSLNQQNLSGPRGHSKTGIRGVYKRKGKPGWVGEVNAFGTQYRKGFQAIEDAEAWVIEKRFRGPLARPGRR